MKDMLTKLCRNAFVLFCCLLVATTAVAQAPNDDSISMALRKEVVKHYSKLLKENLLLYTGTEYRGSYSNTIGHPYFNSDTLQPATITFNGVTYYDIPLQYDLVQDEVVIHDYDRNFKIRLDKKSIQSFDVNGHRFVQVNESSSAARQAVSFYEELYKGESTVLVKRKKQLAVSIKEDERSRFIEYLNFYIEKEGKFYAVNSEGALLRVLKDKKDELKKLIRQNKLSYKKAPESLVVQVTTLYDRLKK